MKRFLMFALLSSCLLIGLQAICPNNLFSQAEDQAEEKPAEATAADFDDLQKQFSEIENRLNAIVRQLRGGTADNPDALITELNEKQEVALRKVLPRLTQSAIAAYKAAPNENETVSETLVKSASILYSTEQYAEALRVAELMIENKSDREEIYDIAGSAAYCTDDFDKAGKYLSLADEKSALQVGGNFFPHVAEYKKMWAAEQAIRKAEAAADDLPRVKMKTSAGDMLIELYENEAPQTVGNFVSLVEKGFYNGLKFHRVLPHFMAQGGDPQGTGGGGPGYKIYCECGEANARMHFSGTLSMAHAGPDTGGSQFFLTFIPTEHLNGKHTVFGRVIEGKDVLAKIKRVDPARGGETDKIIEATVVRKRDHVYEPTKVE